MITLMVEGMSCDHCVRSVREALEAIAGVGGVVVDLEAGRAELDVEGDVEDRDMVQALDDEGFQVKSIERG